MQAKIDQIRFTLALMIALSLLGGIWVARQAAQAASEISVTAFSCPGGTDPATDAAALGSLCTEPAVDVTFALTASDLTRRRIATADKPASWPAVAGQFVLSIETPTGEPAIALCDQNGTITRYEAPAGVINGELAAGLSLACTWFRLLPGSTAVEPTPTIAPTVASSPPAQTDFAGTVDIGGRKLFVSCTGTGSPTVLLEAGGPGGSSSRWAVIVPQIAQTTRVCSYDRAGTGQSDPAPAGVRTLQNSVDDLRLLLAATPIGCPCVMVGESWGGSLVRLYAGQFYSDIAGIVFVDALPVGFIEQFLSLVPSSESGFSDLMGVDSIERMDQLASFRLADTANPPPPVPIVSITHGLFLGFPLNFPVADLEASWQTNQHDYARSIHARYVTAKTSGNSILTDQPDLIVNEVKLVVEAARNPAAIQTTIVVERRDSLGRPAPGSCFQIYTDGGNGARGEYRGGACDPDADSAIDGDIVFAPLPPGSYVIQEVQAPAGSRSEPDTLVAASGLETMVTVQPAAPATPPAGTPTN